MNIVITGASHGIGYETALLLARQGHTVFAIARNDQKLEQLRKEAGSPSEIILLPGDLTNETFLTKAAKNISETVSTLDLLINNAGLLINKPFEQLTLQDWKSVYEVNVFSVVNLIQTLLPNLLNGPEKVMKSHILNISV